jgi:hypothetical protein
MPLRESLDKNKQKKVYNMFKADVPPEKIAQEVKATLDCVMKFTPERQDKAAARIKEINDRALSAHQSLMDAKNNPALAAAKAVAETQDKKDKK